MNDLLLSISLALHIFAMIIIYLMYRKLSKSTSYEPLFHSLEKTQERMERRMHEDLLQIRHEIGGSSRENRDELMNTLYKTNDTMRSTLEHSLDRFSKQLSELTKMSEHKLEGVRNVVEQKLAALQEDNGKKLEQMRLTVDEKLHATLEQRLGDSFKQVSDRLEQVHKGLGEMQSLASGVGDLKKVLTNVKSRGTMGEIQLGNLLEQILTSDQYETNCAMKKNSGERIEFAVKLPAKDSEQDDVYLPIDSKFPLEDYQRLVEAQEIGDIDMANEATKQLENRIKAEAKTIRDKYINPPYTTDFAVMFLPLEGLFAEILRRPGLWDVLQREYRVIITGPTTLSAFLNSLQMGFRTLAIQERSSEVWHLLGAVKTEFGKFGDVLDKTKKKLQEASNTIDSAATRTRVIERKLRNVQELPASDTEPLFNALEEVESGVSGTRV